MAMQLAAIKPRLSDGLRPRNNALPCGDDHSCGQDGILEKIPSDAADQTCRDALERAPVLWEAGMALRQVLSLRPADDYTASTTRNAPGVQEMRMESRRMYRGDGKTGLCWIQPCKQNVEYGTTVCSMRYAASHGSKSREAAVSRAEGHEGSAESSDDNPVSVAHTVLNTIRALRGFAFSTSRYQMLGCGMVPSSLPHRP